MRKHPSFVVMAILASLVLILAACQNGGESPTEAAETEPAETEPAETAAPEADFNACEVSDVGGIDDKGFNQNAFEGLELAEAELGVEIDFLESAGATDYDRNIQTWIDQGCDIIVTVGFLLGDATATAAEANPDQLFTIVDFAYDPPFDNVQGLVFATDEASMMAGYLAAGMSESGTVGTFGGINIPPVSIFMDGFAAGINYFNDQRGADVQLLGWDPANPEGGTFVNNFESLEDGRNTAEALMQEGADVIFPVAGPVGLGAMAAVQDRGELFIGVDVDQYISTDEEFADIMLSSVLKRIDNAVFAAIEDAMDGAFDGPIYEGTLENEGVGLAPYHDFEGEVPPELTDEIEALRQAIISGDVAVADWTAP
ncbi:MAG: BMP family lipoprotein [Candidatus Limnocylindria bacterium]